MPKCFQKDFLRKIIRYIMASGDAITPRHNPPMVTRKYLIERVVHRGLTR